MPRAPSPSLTTPLLTPRTPIDLRRYSLVMPLIEGYMTMRECVTLANQPKQHTPVRLGAVTSYNIVLKSTDGDCRLVYLQDVPVYVKEEGERDSAFRFLIDAFNLLRIHGQHTEGIFRKEGNSSRLKDVWVGLISRLQSNLVDALLWRHRNPGQSQSP